MGSRAKFSKLPGQGADLGLTHPGTLLTRWLRAVILERLGHYEQALAEIDGTDQLAGILSLLERAPTLARRITITLGTGSLRGAILYDLGDHGESERELRSVGAEQEETLGLVHDFRLRTGHRLATTLVALGRFSEAEQLLRTAIAGRCVSLAVPVPVEVVHVVPESCPLGPFGTRSNHLSI